jgi:Ca-activated chloride channel family protein
MDVSGSMGAEAEGTDTSKLALAQRAAVNALGQFSSRDQVGLWIFSTGQDPPRDYRELVPIGPMSAQVDGQPRRNALRSRIEGLTPDGGTGLYDTSAAAFEFVKGRIDPAKINAVVLLTDGKNEDDGISVEQLLQRITTEPGAESVRLFTVAYGQDADLNVLKRIAQQTNAAAYDSLDPARIDEVFAAVISNF